MNRFSSVVLTAAVLAIAMGCGGSPGVGVVEGDKLIVTTDLERESVDASYGESVRNVSHTNRWNVEIPEGTVLEVFVTPSRGVNTIEVRPVKVVVDRRNEDGDVETVEITDERELRDFFVPDRYLTFDFLYYTISLSGDYLDSKVKKME